MTLPFRDRVRLVVRPIIRRLTYIEPPPPTMVTVYLVGHPSFRGRWLRNPYRDGAGDPRYDWTADLTKASRFVTPLLAERASLDAGYDGIVTPLEVPR